MKFVVKTGSESHSTSSSRFQAKFANGPHTGKFLYEVKNFIKKTNWDENTKHATWATSEYDLPEGTHVLLTGKGQDGPRGADKYIFERIYALEESAEIVEEYPEVGPGDPYFKGRLRLIKDAAAEKAAANAITDDGF